MSVLLADKCQGCDDKTFYCRFCYSFCPFTESNHIVECCIDRKNEEKPIITKDLGKLDKNECCNHTIFPNNRAYVNHWYTVSRICSECYEKWFFTENGYSLIKGT